MSTPTNTPDTVVVADRVAVAGDWHGETGWALDMLTVAAANGIRVVLHAGDFGIWPGNSGAKFLRKVNRRCAELDLHLLVTPGNHENYDHLDAVDPVDRGDGFGLVQWVTDRVGVLPRGHRFTLQTSTGITRTVVSLGGGPSLDYAWRIPGATWWPQEAIRPRDVETVAAGGFADLMVTHDAPGAPYQVPAVEQICSSNPMGWSDSSLAYATEQRNLVTAAFEAVAPRMLFHGHFHAAGIKQVPVGDSECTVVCLPHQYAAGNLVAVDVGDLTVVGLTDPPWFTLDDTPATGVPVP